MKKYILNPISLFFIGAILGIISKLLDILFVGNLFMMTLGYMFSDLPIWVLLGILFTIIGNYMPKMSYETGKKLFHPTPKTEKSFRRMSRIMGYGFLGIGIILLIMIIWV